MSSGGASTWSSGSIPLIAPDLLGGIIASAADLALVVSPEGRVLSVMQEGPSPRFPMAQDWIGEDLRDRLAPDSIGKLDDRLRQLSEDEAPEAGVELNHSDPGGASFPIRYAFHRIGPDGTVLMLGRDLRPIAEMQEQLLQAQLPLEQDYDTQRDYDTRYRVLMDSTRDALVFVSLGSGRITDANAAAAALLETGRESLTGAVLAQEFEGRRRGELMEALANAAMAEGAGPLEMQARRTGQTLRLTARAFRAAGERLLLVRLDPEEKGAPQASDLSDDLGAMFSAAVDAMVFTDADGVIRAANDAFLGLTDSAHLTTVKGRSLAEFLSRGAVDLKVLLDNTARNGQMRMYATKLAGEFGNLVSVEMSATWLTHRTNPAVAFVIRDASRAEAMRRPPGPGVSDDAVRSVMELVGSATLKDIVAETTDVVEKMCVETAVELTRNNRVAAAEMLGLSRQSLYVKLRKYGLLSRDSD